ncbi:unnamed protein product [Pleuronectes platessa]|uniref:Uncharacterized protein n=1 Tax=Pleuronectes platessa TaxID=8262 RepID=A0A9N7VGL6_PLEPL|nr:unnamed protein product [Pleuronectes platessa]
MDQRKKSDEEKKRRVDQTERGEGPAGIRANLLSAGTTWRDKWTDWFPVITACLFSLSVPLFLCDSLVFSPGLSVGILSAAGEQQREIETCVLPQPPPTTACALPFSDRGGHTR